MCDFPESLTAYKKIRKPDFEGLVGLALAANKCGRLEEAYNAYTASVGLASNDADRSHVLAAMATIAYKIQVLINALLPLWL